MAGGVAFLRVLGTLVPSGGGRPFLGLLKALGRFCLEETQDSLPDPSVDLSKI
jgi:hypothetical protein